MEIVEFSFPETLAECTPQQRTAFAMHSEIMWNRESTDEYLACVLNKMRACRVLGAIDDTGITRGYAVFESENSRNETNLHYLCVDPDTRSRGIGGLLLECVVETARDQNSPAISLMSSVEAVDFYKRHGFETYEVGQPTWLRMQLPVKTLQTV